MKKIMTVFALLMGIIINGYGQDKGYPNPAVAYIQKMGYTLETRVDSRGNQYSVCIFPDGTVADAWAFLTGKAGTKFSYCAKQGYSTETGIVNHGSWTEEMAVCTKVTSNGKKETIPMVDLMKKNGEPLIDTEDQGKHETEGSEQPVEQDPRLKDALSSNLPGSFDWRNTPAGYPYPEDPQGLSYIGPVRDQGNCGSCYAFGACDNSEGVYNVANHLYDIPASNVFNCVDFSESFIMWCLGKLPQYNKNFYGCKGADYSYSELEAQVTDGIILEKDFPLVTKDPGICTHWNDFRYSFSNWYRVACLDTEGVKQAIYHYGVVDAAVYANSSFVNYQNGIYQDNSNTCPGTQCYYAPVNHAVGLVGWGGQAGARYFILRNSWGSTWGQSGYMFIDMFSAHVGCQVGYLTLDPISCTENTTNQSFSTATPLTTNTEVNGKLYSTNSDYYSFSTTSLYSNVEVQLYTLPSNYDLTLYDANSNVIATSNKSSLQPEKIIYNTKRAGTYYVSVTIGSGGAPGSSCYTLLASTAKAGWSSSPDGNAVIVNDNSGQALTVYPNPSPGTFNLDYNARASGKVEVTVYSVSGQKILNKEFIGSEGLNTYSFDLGKQSPGLYFIELRDLDGELFGKISLE